jgi:hypothetical protein
MSTYQKLNLSQKQHFQCLLTPEIMFTIKILKSLPQCFKVQVFCIVPTSNALNQKQMTLEKTFSTANMGSYVHIQKK